MFLTESSSQLISPVAYISCSIPVWSFASDSLLVVPRFNDNFFRLLGSLNILHGFDQLGKKFRGRVSAYCRGSDSRGKRGRWCCGAADQNFIDVFVVDNNLHSRRSGIATKKRLSISPGRLQSDHFLCLGATGPHTGKTQRSFLAGP